MEMGTKTCSKCRQVKLRDHFGRNRSKRDGLQSYCKECKKSCQAKYYQRNRTEVLERNAAYKATNKDRLSESQAAYYQANRQVILKRNADYQQRNRERMPSIRPNTTSTTVNESWHGWPTIETAGTKPQQRFTGNTARSKCGTRTGTVADTTRRTLG